MTDLLTEAKVKKEFEERLHPRDRKGKFRRSAMRALRKLVPPAIPSTQEPGNAQGRYVWLRGRRVFIPRGKDYHQWLDGTEFHSPAGGTNIYRNGNLIQVEGQPPPPHHQDLNPPGIGPPGDATTPKLDPGTKFDPGLPTTAPPRLSPEAADAALLSIQAAELARVDLAARIRTFPKPYSASFYAGKGFQPEDMPILPGTPLAVADDVLTALGFAIPIPQYDSEVPAPGGGRRRWQVWKHQPSGTQIEIYSALDTGQVTVSAFEHGAMPLVVPEPLNRPPKTWEEFGAELRGVAYRLAEEHNLTPLVGEVLHDPALGDHAGTHNSGSGIIRLGDETTDALAQGMSGRRALGAAALRSSYASYKVGVHEALHGAGPVITGQEYSVPEYKAVEEALVEELAHVEAVKLLRAHGQTNVLRWAAGNPTDVKMQGSYGPFRARMDMVLTEAGIAPELREERLRELKFENAPGQERIDKLGEWVAANPHSSFHGDARSARVFVTDTMRAEGGTSTDYDLFRPQVRADLRDFPNEERKVFNGKAVDIGSVVRVNWDTPGPRSGTVVGVQESRVPGFKFAMDVRWNDNGTVSHNVMDIQLAEVLSEERRVGSEVNVREGLTVGVGDLIRYNGRTDGELSEARITAIRELPRLRRAAPGWEIEAITTENSLKPDTPVMLTENRVRGRIERVSGAAPVAPVIPLPKPVPDVRDVRERRARARAAVMGEPIAADTPAERGDAAAIDGSGAVFAEMRDPGARDFGPIPDQVPKLVMVGQSTYETPDGRITMYRIPGLRPAAWNVEWTTDFAFAMGGHENADYPTLQANLVDGAATKRDALAFFAEGWPETRAKIEKLEADLAGEKGDPGTPTETVERPSHAVTITRRITPEHLSAYQLRKDAKEAEYKRNALKEFDADGKLLPATDELRQRSADADASVLAAAAAEETAGGRVYRVSEAQRAKLDAQIKKLAKSAGKLGLAEPTVTEVGEEWVESRAGTPDVAEGMGERQRFEYVQVKGEEPKIAGWEFLASLQNVEGSNIIRRVPGSDEAISLDEFRHADAVCDYCKTKRDRKMTFVVHNDAEGVKRVGSSCIRDFLGHGDPAAIAAYMENWHALDALGEDDDYEEGGGGGARMYVPTDAFLIHVATMMRENGWVSRSAAGPYSRATADLARENHYAYTRQITDKKGNPTWVEPNENDMERARAALEWARTDLAAKPNKSEFDHNMVTLASAEHMPERGEGILAYVVPAHSREIEREIEQRRKAESNADSKHVGEVGDRLTVRARVESIFEREGDYGTTYITKLVDDQGNIYKWFGSSELERDKVYEGKFTVKKHDEFKGVKETVLTRPSGLVEYDPDAPPPAEKPTKKGQRVTLTVPAGDGETATGEIEKAQKGFDVYLDGVLVEEGVRTWQKAQDELGFAVIDRNSRRAREEYLLAGVPEGEGIVARYGYRNPHNYITAPESAFVQVGDLVAIRKSEEGDAAYLGDYMFARPREDNAKPLIWVPAVMIHNEQRGDHIGVVAPDGTEKWLWESELLVKPQASGEKADPGEGEDTVAKIHRLYDAGAPLVTILSQVGTDEESRRLIGYHTGSSKRMIDAEVAAMTAPKKTWRERLEEDLALLRKQIGQTERRRAPQTAGHNAANEKEAQLVRLRAKEQKMVDKIASLPPDGEKADLGDAELLERQQASFERLLSLPTADTAEYREAKQVTDTTRAELERRGVPWENYADAAEKLDPGVEPVFARYGVDVVAPVPGPNVGIHSTGDFGPAEVLRDQMPAGRQEGHFGTGFYFVGDAGQLGGAYTEDAEGRRIVGLDLSGRNLFKPADDRQAFDLHDRLRDLNDLALLGEERAELGQTFTREVSLEDVRDRLSTILGVEVPLGDVRDAWQEMANAVKRTNDTNDWGAQDELASSRLMKALGFDGVDVRGLERIDHTGYGSVLYADMPDGEKLDPGEMDRRLETPIPRLPVHAPSEFLTMPKSGKLRTETQSALDAVDGLLRVPPMYGPIPVRATAGKNTRGGFVRRADAAAPRAPVWEGPTVRMSGFGKGRGIVPAKFARELEPGDEMLISGGYRFEVVAVEPVEREIGFGRPPIERLKVTLDRGENRGENRFTSSEYKPDELVGFNWKPDPSDVPPAPDTPPAEIRVSTQEEEGVPFDSSATLIHELGHYIDNQAFLPYAGHRGMASMHASWRKNDQEIRTTAIEKQRAEGSPVGALEDMEAGESPLADWYEVVKASPEVEALGSGVSYSEAATHKYLLSPAELWARSFTQWVALRSGEPKLMRWLRDHQNQPPMLTLYRERWASVIGGRREKTLVPYEVKRPGYMTLRQWTDENFAPIAESMDRTFERLGWLRGDEGADTGGRGDRDTDLAAGRDAGAGPGGGAGAGAGVPGAGGADLAGQLAAEKFDPGSGDGDEQWLADYRARDARSRGRTRADDIAGYQAMLRSTELPRSDVARYSARIMEIRGEPGDAEKAAAMRERLRQLTSGEKSDPGHGYTKPSPEALDMPQGTTLWHTTNYPDDIRTAGFKASPHGESGPGVYLTDDPAFRDRMTTWEQTSGRGGVERTALAVTTNRPLRLLDRSTPEGEKLFRDVQLEGSISGEGAQPGTLSGLRKLGYDGVRYDSFGDVEVVVHDPSALSFGTGEKLDPGADVWLDPAAEVWRIPLKGYAPVPVYEQAEFDAYIAGEAPPEVAERISSAFETERTRKKEWEAAMRHALSLGQVKLPEAKALGYDPRGHEREDEYVKGTGWQPLPQDLWHVTTAASAVRAQGLKSRAELSQARGAGLGGGDDETISFTTDPKIAADIERGLREMRAAVRNEFTVQDMIDQAQRGDNADSPWFNDWMRQVDHGWKPGEPLPREVQDALDGVERGSGATVMPGSEDEVIAKLSAGTEWKPPSTGWRLAPGQGPMIPDAPQSIYTAWQFVRTMTPEEQGMANAALLRNWMPWREQHGGPSDPMFFSANLEGLASIPPEEIETLRVRPHAGGQGYPMGGMMEWRTNAGGAVELVEPAPWSAPDRLDPGEKFDPGTVTISVPDAPEAHGMNRDTDNEAVRFERWRDQVRKQTGQLVRGDPISPTDPRIPETLYHATTNLQAVQADGYLRARGAGGLGGDKSDKIVSLTTDELIAAQIAADLHLLGQLGREFPSMPQYSSRKRPVTADDDPWVREHLTETTELGHERVAENRRVVAWLQDRAREQGFEFEPDAESWPDSYPSLVTYDIGDWMNQWYNVRQSKTGVQNPVIFNTSETARSINPDGVGIVRVPRSSLQSGALVTDFDLKRKSGLKEIRVYGDVAVS